MKYALLGFLLITMPLIGKAQQFEPIYFDVNNQQASADNYAYKRIIEKNSSTSYLLKDYYHNGSIKRECTYLVKKKYIPQLNDFIHPESTKGLKLDGVYKTYYSNGQLKKEDFYIKGKDTYRSIKYTEDGEATYFIVDNNPEYPGGEAQLMAFIASEVKYPEKAKAQKISGMVFISFVVTKEGKVTDTTVARGVHPLLDSEALRVINLLDNWKPGSHKGKPVNVAYTVPINFVL
ncbi:TonB family protein [Carboxylicivirga mesophila]|uniref:TonB family protein n=1 Tax=Carboxylicivirga mesophila TaxID=1166478 RepID=A0ABS5KFQ0_9BACT|nr:energy transducer TonB [Carboxylicivirga mesophila]MBS2213894.1 TonB family protein [Carboxylicivirga mesophila]